MLRKKSLKRMFEKVMINFSKFVRLEFIDDFDKFK